MKLSKELENLVNSLASFLEVEIMIKVYFDLIIRPGSSFTINMVPERWREQVRKMLIDNGYEDLAGNGVNESVPDVDDGIIAHR